MNAHAFAVPDRPSAPREPEPFDEIAARDRILDQAERHFRSDAPELREFLVEHEDAAERFAEIVTLLLGDGIARQRARAAAARLRDEFLKSAVDAPWCARVARVPFVPNLSEVM